MLGHRRVEKDDYVRWHRILNAHGWGAPRLLPFGLLMIGPVLMKYASADMQARFLPRIPGMDDFWCQGYSEPGAGSDLASLKTRAVR